MRSHTPVLAALLVVALAMAGCSSSGERAYYQTRYIPSSGDALYTASEKSRWHGDLQVYELPGNPPALGEEHRARRDCVQPGPGFPINGKVAYRDVPRGGGQVALQEAGGFDQRPARLQGPLTQEPHLIAKTADVTPAGLPQRNFRTDAGGFDGRPRPGTGPDTGDAQAIDRMRDQDKWDYCLEPHATPLTANDRSRGVAAPAAR